MFGEAGGPNYWPLVLLTRDEVTRKAYCSAAVALETELREMHSEEKVNMNAIDGDLTNTTPERIYVITLPPGVVPGKPLKLLALSGATGIVPQWSCGAALQGSWPDHGAATVTGLT